MEASKPEIFAYWPALPEPKKYKEKASKEKKDVEKVD
jgi:hypothetical protein